LTVLTRQPETLMMEVTSTMANFFVIFCVGRPVLFPDRQRQDPVRGGTMSTHRQKTGLKQVSSKGSS